MSGNLRFALTALTWAMILLAIYALTARAEIREPLHSPAGVGWAAQAGTPRPACAKGKVSGRSDNRWTDHNASSSTMEGAFSVTRRSL